MRTLTFLLLGLISWTCQASTITISVDADLLKTSDGSPMPTNGLVLLVASTTDSTFNGPTAGSFVTGDDVILYKFDLTTPDGGTPGVLNNIATGLVVTGNWTAGDPLAIYWFPTLTTNSLAPSAGTPYGMYTTTTPLDDSSPWVTPSPGSTISLRFITQDADPGSDLAGSNPSSAGLANLTVPGGLTAPNLAISLLGGNNVNIHLTGAANAPYALQYVNSLLSSGNSWQTLSNGTSDGNGVIDFHDSIGASPRFYRSQAQ